MGVIIVLFKLALLSAFLDSAYGVGQISMSLSASSSLDGSTSAFGSHGFFTKTMRSSAISREWSGRLRSSQVVAHLRLPVRLGQLSGQPCSLA
jgi:hypothetical protein